MPDTKAPIILSGPTVSSTTDTTATVEWQTDEPAKGTVVYGTSPPPGTTVSESTFTSSHATQLTGLSPNTTYYVQVTAADAVGNGPASSSVISFTTSPTPDRAAPVILTGPTVNTITHTSAVVEWTTDEPTTGAVTYGPVGGTSQAASDTAISTSHRVTLSGLSPQTLYSLRVTATDAAGNVSAANGSDFPTLAAPDTAAPVITLGPMAINISDTGATIVWQTDEPSTSGVSWDDGTAHGVLSDNTLTTDHSVIITGLKAATSYNFTVSSKDAFGNGPTLSTAKSFTTKAAPDTIGPVFIHSPIVKNTTHQSVDLYWETDESAAATIQFGTTPSLGLTDSKAQLLSKHNRPLTGLLPGTTYYFRVQATDAANNSSSSGIYFFTTDLNPDTKAPVITEEANIVYSTDTAATVAFTTDKPCDTVVNYGPNGTAGHQKSDSEKVNDHQVTLTNLAPNTSYTVQVSCTDMSGNTVVASAGTPSTMMAMNYSFILSDVFIGATGTGFVTRSQPDETAPAITSPPRATGITSTMVRIHWLTDEIADSQVFYGLPGQSLTNSAGDIVKSAGHSVALTNLSPNTMYQFKVQSTDPSNNTVTSPVYSFTTAAVADTTAPAISAISATGPTSSQINVSWTTDEPATTVLMYGTTPFTLTAQTAVAGSRTSHSVSLYNLVPGTTYYVAPVSTDSSGNSTQGETQSVTLSGAAPASYTVNAVAGVGGRIAPVSQTVYSGYQLALAVTPSRGYLINSITGCGGTLSGNIYTTAAVTGDCSVSVTFSVNPNLVKEDPIIISSPTASGITFGQAVSASTLSGGAGSVPGTFVFTTPATVPAAAGTFTASITFNPTDSVNYNSVTGTVVIAVAKATPTINTLPTATAITFRQPLSSSTLTGGSGSVGGSFAFTSPATVPAAAGNYSAAITFTPTAAANHNSVSGSVVVTVLKATPTITTLPTASSITLGQALSFSTLTGGTASVPGTFAFTSPATTPGASGNYSAAVTFTPNDAANYNSLSRNVTLMILARSVNGSCGSSNGKAFAAAPTRNLCSSGQATSVSGTVPWSWNCNGTDGGTNASCSASNTLPATAPVATATKPSADLAAVKPGTTFTVYRTGGGATNTTVQTGPGSSFTDTSTLKPNTIYQYTVASDSDESLTNVMTIRTPLYSGWNIISVPYATTGVSPTAFFGSAVSSIYQWIPTGTTTEESTAPPGSYVTVSSLAPGNGYFVKASTGSTLLAYSGAEGAASATVTLKPGWTMIANPNAATKNDIGANWLVDNEDKLGAAIIQGKIAGGIYWWNGTTYDSWSILQQNPQIEPWKGYWILNLDSVPHTLTIQ